MPAAVAMRRERSITLIDTQSGGDVSRVVTDGIEPIPGTTALEKARFLEREGDGLRRLLLSEPYGDPAMSVDLIVEPGHPEAQAGYIIMEAMGYPMYSGSNTLCVVTALLESGMIEMVEGEQQIVLESPAGLARITARNADGRVESVTTQGAPAYVADRALTIEVPAYGPVTCDLVWSGGYYAMIDATAHGFSLAREEEIALTAFGDAFVRAARPRLHALCRRSRCCATTTRLSRSWRPRCQTPAATQVRSQGVCRTCPLHSICGLKAWSPMHAVHITKLHRGLQMTAVGGGQRRASARRTRWEAVDWQGRG